MSEAEVMGEEYREVRDFYVEKIRSKGNENLADILETETSQKIVKEDWIDGLKTAYPEHKAQLESLREEIEELQKDGSEATDWTQYFEERQNGSLKFQPKWLADDIEDDFTFRKVRDSEELYVYKNGYYQEKGKQIILEETERRLGDEWREARVRDVIGIIEARNFIKRKDFRPPQRKINLKNGVYDLEREELLDHSDQYYFKQKIPVKYNPDASCPNIHSFLNDIVESEEEVKTLQEIAGYVLLADYPIPKAFMLIGKGNNGKSRYLDLLRELVGESNLTEKGLQTLGERFGPHELSNTLGCLDDDLSSRKIDEEAAGTLKKLTGGSRIGAEVKYGGHYNFWTYSKQIFACNELPRTADDSDGFYRRWILVEFPYKFKENPDPENDREKQGIPKKRLMENITNQSEIEGFLWWAIESLKDVLANDEFTHAPTTQEAREKWREYSVPLVKFIQTYVRQGVTRNQAEREADESDSVESYSYDYVRKDFLSELIGDYCEARSHSRPSKKAISKELEKEFYVGTKSRTRKEPEDKRVPVYSGIKLDYPDVGGCPGVQTYSSTFTRVCACAQVRSSKQSVDTGTGVEDDVSSLEAKVEKWMKQNASEDSVLVQDVFESMSDHSEEELENALDTLKQEGIVYEPKHGQVQLL